MIKQYLTKLRIYFCTQIKLISGYEYSDFISTCLMVVYFRYTTTIILISWVGHGCFGSNTTWNFKCATFLPVSLWIMGLISLYIYRIKFYSPRPSFIHYTHFLSFLLSATFTVSHSNHQLSFTVLQHYAKSEQLTCSAPFYPFLRIKACNPGEGNILTSSCLVQSQVIHSPILLGIRSNLIKFNRLHFKC